MGSLQICSVRSSVDRFVVTPEDLSTSALRLKQLNSKRSVTTRYISKIFMILSCREFSADVCDLSVPFFFLFQSNTIKRILKIVDISSKLVFWPTFI